MSPVSVMVFYTEDEPFSVLFFQSMTIASKFHFLNASFNIMEVNITFKRLKKQNVLFSTGSVKLLDHVY